MDEDIFNGDDFGGLEDIDEDMLRAYLEGLFHCLFKLLFLDWISLLMIYRCHSFSSQGN